MAALGSPVNYPQVESFSFSFRNHCWKLTFFLLMMSNIFFSWDSYVFQFQTYRWVPFIQIIELLISWFPSTIFSLRAKFKSPFSPMWWSEQIKNKYTRTTTTRANVVEWHNNWQRTNWLLCRFKGGKPLIAFRVSGSTKLTISYESL